jgi:hypothetical protein
VHGRQIRFSLTWRGVERALTSNRRRIFALALPACILCLSNCGTFRARGLWHALCVRVSRGGKQIIGRLKRAARTAFAREFAMRRILLVTACLGILFFAGTTTALAKGPHHGGYARHGHGHHHRHGDGRWSAGYRGGYGRHCGPRGVAYYPAYPAYPAYAAPYYGSGYSNFGFGVAGRNFSLWLQQ